MTILTRSWPGRLFTLALLFALLTALSATSNDPALRAEAQAAAWSWKAGEVYTDYNDGGPLVPHIVGFTSQGIFFPALGLCDEYGYTVNTDSFNWPIRDEISSMFVTNLNGCDSVTLIRADGARWSCSTSCMKNAPKPYLIQIGGGFQNAGLAKINFWGHNRVIAGVPANSPLRQGVLVR